MRCKIKKVALTMRLLKIHFLTLLVLQNYFLFSPAGFRNKILSISPILYPLTSESLLTL